MIYHEKAKDIEVIGNYDVLVIGGGPSGLGAAIGAAKCGSSVMLIESQGAFGGMWTNGLVITLGGFNSWLRPYRRCVDGAMGEWLRMSEEIGGAEDNRSWVLNSDPEKMKLVADTLINKYHIHCLLHTLMSDVIMDGNSVKGVIIENIEGRKAIMSKVTIDCTGNGDVFARAGAGFDLAEEVQPMTLPFFLAQVNPSGEFKDELTVPFGPEPGYLGKELLRSYTSRRMDVEIDQDILNEAYSDGKLPCFGGPWFGGMRRNYPWVNTTRIYGSALNAAELTECEIEGRNDAFKIADYYKNNIKGFENSWIMSTGSTLGIRESRRLKGVYTLTSEDIAKNHKFEDSIAIGVWPLDVHPPKGENGMHDMFVPLPYGIPYRCLLPIDVDNLLVAGRCISADREAMGSTRVGATCGALGQAAGVAAALSVVDKCSPRKVNIEKLHDELKNENSIF
jgi:hypothetical protein